MAASMLASKSCTAAWRLARLEKGLLASFKVGCIAGPFRLGLSRGVLTSTKAVIATQTWRNRRDKQQLDFTEIVQGLEHWLGKTGLAKAAEMNKLLDCVETEEQLEVAEGLLVRFAASPNPVRASFPVILARACIRVKRPQRARHIFEQKTRFGVYPTRRVYHMLMDVFLRRRNYREVLSTYSLMLADGVEPKWASHYLAFHAHLWRGADGDLDRALELQQEVIKGNPQLKRKTQQLVIKACTNRRWVEKALSYVAEYEQEYGLGRQDAFILKLRCLTIAGQLKEAIELLRRTGDSGAAIWPPEKSTIFLIRNVLSSKDQGLKQSLRETLEALSSLPKFHPSFMKALNSAALEETSSSDIATSAAEEEEGEVNGKEEEISQPDSEGKDNGDSTSERKR